MKSHIVALILLLFVFLSLTIGALVANNGTNQGNQPQYPAVPPKSNASSFDHFMSIKSVHESGDIYGMSCKLWINHDSAFGEGQSLPVCIIIAANESTNRYWFENIPIQGSCEVKLLDPQGREVNKTADGQKFGFWTIKQLYDWGYEHVYDGQRVFAVSEGTERQYYPGFSIPQLFQLKAPGEYTLRVRVQLVRYYEGIRHFIESEASTNVEIRPEDIPPADLSANSQTNSPAK